MAHIQIPDTAPRVQYSVGASPDSDFTIPFAYFQDADIVVYDGETKQTITTHYTIAGTAVDEGFSGGTVNLVTAVTNTTITIYRDVSVTRSTDFPTNGQFDITQLNTELDKMTAQIQQVEYDVQNRCIRFGQFTTGIPVSEFTESAITRANKVIGFDANGDPSITQELGTYQGTDATTTTANYGVRDLVKDSSTSNVYLCIATSTSGTLLTNTSYWALIVDAASAATSATNAAASATAAAASETNAANSETNADNSRISAAYNAALISVLYDSFDDRYLGAKATDPTLDNDGDALLDGALYFDTTNNVTKVYDLGGTVWKRTIPTTTEQANIDAVTANATNINTVAGVSSNVTTVAGISANVTTVANNDARITSLADDIDRDFSSGYTDAALTSVNAEILAITVGTAPVDQVLYDLITSTVNGYQRGDIDNDDDIDISDSSDVARFIAGTEDFTWIRNNILGPMLADMPTYGSYFDSAILTVSNDLDDIQTVATDITNVSTAALNIADINTVAADATDIGTVATNIADVSTVAGISANTTTVAGISSDVTAVAGDATDIGTVAGKATEIGRLGTADAVADMNTLGTAAIVTDMDTLADISANITTVAGVSANVTTVAGNNANITTVAGVSSDISTVATNIADVTTVATNISDVVTVANDLNEAISEIETAADDLNEAVSEIDTVSNAITNVDNVGNNIANVNTVAGIASNVTTVAGNNANVTTVAGNNTNITTVAGVSTNVTAVAGSTADMDTCATNIANINLVASNINTGVIDGIFNYGSVADAVSSSSDYGSL